MQDRRVDIVRPRDRDEARLPVRVEWSVKDFATGAGRGAFGVFLDRAPQPSGKTQAWLFRGDDACKGSGKSVCATPEFLAQRNVYRTTSNRFTVTNVARVPDNEGRREFHEVTIVLLDREGRRVGEGAWSVQFQLEEDR